MDLPGLKVEDIEAVLSEKSDWSGEEIEQFLRSAVDLSEMEAKLLSSGGYESDSGYSTTPYDVSPITSSAPLQLSCYTPGGSFHSLSAIDQTPLLGNLSPTTPSFSLPASLSHDPSSATSDVMGFFPGPSSYTSPFFPEPPAMPQPFLPSYSCSTSSGGSLNGFSSLTSGFSSEFTEFLASSCSFDSSSKPGISNVLPLTCTSSTATMTSSSQRSSDGQMVASVASGRPLRTLESNLFESRTAPDVGKVVQGDGRMEKSQSGCFDIDGLPQSDVSTIKVEANPSCYAYSSGKRTSLASLGDDINARDEAPSSGSHHTPDTPKVVLSPHTSEPSSVVRASGQLHQQNSESQAQADASSSGNSSKLRSLMATCSQLPVLNKLLASSNNPTVFLMAISTALSTLTGPFLSGGDDTSEGAAEMTTVVPAPGKDGQFSIEQLQSIVSKLTPAQLEQLMKVKSDPQLATSAQPTSPVVRPNGLPALPERTVFASVLPASRGPITSSCSPTVSNSCCASVSGGPSVPVTTQHRYSMHSKSNIGTKPSGLQTTTGKKTTSALKPRIHKTNNHPAMKSSQKKKQAQWPRSMNQANLMAFREHILNKLKMSPDGQGDTGSISEGNKSHPSSMPMTNGRMFNEVTVKCERNHLPGRRCQSAPAAICSSRVEPTMSTLRSSASESNINYGSDNAKIPALSDLLSQTSSCVDLFDASFNPDTLLSSSTLTLPDDLFEGMAACPSNYECPQTMEDDDELRQLLGEGGNSAMDVNETPTSGTDSISELLSEAQRTISGDSPPPSVTVTSPVDREASEFAQSGASGSYTELKVSTVQTSATLQQAELLTPPHYTFPAANSIHGSMTALNSVKADDISPMQMCIEQNLGSVILQTHHDPLLAGNACSMELFEF